MALRTLALCAAALSAASGQPIDDKFFFDEGKVRVLILSGRNNHEWRETTPHLRRILEATGRFDVRVTEEPAGLNEAALRPYHVLVSDYCGPRLGPAAETAIEGFVRSGKGLVAVHAATYPFGARAVLGSRMSNTGVHEPPWPEWERMTGAAWTEKPERTGHGRRHVFEVKWRDHAHPVAAGMPPSFHISDELYHRFRLGAHIKVLATAFDAKEMNGTGRDEPLIWTVDYGAGRVFHTALGHDVAAMQAPGFIASLARGVEWAATGKVTLPPRIALDPKDKDAVRALLVTGGHDHEASFYAVFEGQRDIRVNVDPHPAAFRAGLAQRYDVLVVYDMLQDLPEERKNNLRAFVESGKGLVVLHHALANFQNWEWWWKEAVGARYVLKEEPGLPASTYLHDVEMNVTPAAGHPIVKGLPPMRIHDEAYKGLWRAPGLQVLLTTDHPASDAAVAWIGPHPKSRVAVIQLGHGREAHENPWFRRLVRQAILWSAGR
jgi:type 1 glutamine amidotransferase